MLSFSLSLSALFKYRISSVSVQTVLRSEVAEGMDDGVPWYWVRNALSRDVQTAVTGTSLHLALSSGPSYARV